MLLVMDLILNNKQGIYFGLPSIHNVVSWLCIVVDKIWGSAWRGIHFVVLFLLYMIPRTQSLYWNCFNLEREVGI